MFDALMIDWLVRFWLSCRSIINSLCADSAPPRAIPQQALAEFTLGGTVPVFHWYLNDVRTRPLKWTTRSVWWNVNKVKRRAERYYGKTDAYLYNALERYPIRDKEVVILGSEMPWYECICCCYGARVTTIEYRKVDCRIPGLKVVTPDQYEKNPTTFDVVLSISSIEHDGLGRYGDPIDPTGDLKAMQQCRRVLRPGGLLILAVPVGGDALVWNAHRIYGRKRFPLLTEGWEVVDSFGFAEGLFDAAPGKYATCQPVFVLKAK